ncbi:MAG: EI24 domain-containing protein [Deltaproteobacteria bacterium]|nr:EI24 domain-containing protein [Deltaproteobacteria bacterium]
MAIQPAVGGGPVALVPSEPPKRPTFVTGLRCLFGGIGWLVTHPNAWALAAVPLIIGIVATAALAFGSIGWVPDLIADLIGPTTSTWAGVGVVVLKILATALALVVGCLLAFAVAQPLAGPALEGLVRQQERDLGAPTREPTSWVRDIGRALLSVVVGYGFGLPAILLLVLISLFVPVAAIIAVPLELLVAACTIAWDLCDFPMSVRGVPIGERVRTIASHGGAVLGFSLGLALAGLVPCLLFFLLPAGVVGATRLMWEVERWERAQPELDSALH